MKRADWPIFGIRAVANALTYRIFCVLSASLLTTLSGNAAGASVPAYTLSSNPSYFGPTQDTAEYSMGFEFTTSQPFLVTDLGFNANGAFAGTHPVGIYSSDDPDIPGNDSQLLVSATVNVPSGGTSATDFVYTALALPFPLPAGTYRIAGTNFDSSSPPPTTQGYYYAGSPFGGINEASGLDYVQGYYIQSSTLARPIVAANDYFLPNFRIAAVPEPASVVMFAMGAITIFVARRRFR